MKRVVYIDALVKPMRTINLLIVDEEMSDEPKYLALQC